MYLDAYPSLRGKTGVINNPYPDVKKAGHSVTSIQDNGRLRFIFVGRLVKLKNLKALINIFHDIALDTNKACLEIYGDGPEKRVLKHMVTSQGLEDIVNIFPPISHEEIIANIQFGYAGILPSLSEVSPNFGLECLKLNKPLIITRFNGLQEIFSHYAVQVDPFDHEEIKATILSFIGTESYRDLTPDPQEGELVRTWKDVAEDTLGMLKD